MAKFSPRVPRFNLGSLKGRKVGWRERAEEVPRSESSRKSKKGGGTGLRLLNLRSRNGGGGKERTRSGEEGQHHGDKNIMDGLRIAMLEESGYWYLVGDSIELQLTKLGVAAVIIAQFSGNQTHCPEMTAETFGNALTDDVRRRCAEPECTPRTERSIPRTASSTRIPSRRRLQDTWSPPSMSWRLHR